MVLLFASDVSSWPPERHVTGTAKAGMCHMTLHVITSISATVKFDSHFLRLARLRLRFESQM